MKVKMWGKCAHEMNVRYKKNGILAGYRPFLS